MGLACAAPCAESASADLARIEAANSAFAAKGEGAPIRVTGASADFARIEAANSAFAATDGAGN